MTVEISPLERHLRAVRGVQRPARSDWAAYERMKADFMRKFPGATPAEYTRAMHEIARKYGI